MAGNALDDAAAAALWRLGNAEREYIGLLYEQNGLRSTPAQTRHSASRTGGSFKIPPGSLRGVFHNHPPRSRNRRSRSSDHDRAHFSAEDIDEARRLGVPSYIAAGNELRRYTPGTSRESEPVLAQLPIEEIRAYLMRRILGREPDDMRGLMR